MQGTKVSEQPFFESITADSFLWPRVLYALPYPESHVPGAITSSTLEGQKSFISRNRVKGGGRQDSSTGVHKHEHFAPTCIHSCSSRFRNHLGRCAQIPLLRHALTAPLPSPTSIPRDQGFSNAQLRYKSRKFYKLSSFTHRPSAHTLLPHWLLATVTTKEKGEYDCDLSEFPHRPLPFPKREKKVVSRIMNEHVNFGISYAD